MAGGWQNHLRSDIFIAADAQMVFESGMVMALECPWHITKALASEGDVKRQIMTGKNSCNDHSGRVAPVVNRNRCEGKEECVIVCPYDVFKIEKLSKEQRSELSFRGKLKALAHGGRQAFVVNPEACHACNLCVKACPENALTLKPLLT